MKKKRWLSILLSLSLLLTLVPTQALAEEGPEGTESACTQTADCPAQVHEPDCPLWQEDSTGPDETGETAPEETAPNSTGSDETVPDETVPGETSQDEPAEPGDPEETQPTVAEVLALQAALDALTGEDNTPALLEPTASVEYVYASYNKTTGKVTYIGTRTDVENVIVNVVDGSTTEWSTGWYVVKSDNNITISDRITVSGDVHLILANGCHLTASAGIQVAEGNSLTIYAQTEGGEEIVGGEAIEGTPGQLTATAAGTDNAGIGGNGSTSGDGESSGPITIYGGIVKATGTGFGAGIGGGGSNNATAGNGTNIAIYGGQVTATGTNGAVGGSAGIGGGGTKQSSASYAGSGSNITISGGTVKATGGNYGAGIGGGYYGAGSAIEISGGNVTATGGMAAAGIGGGSHGAGSGITISGGTVRASSGMSKNRAQGAGIGGGYYGAGSNITITGGTVEATSYNGGAGIGGGHNGAGSTIEITGGTVTAISKQYGAGIGGGYNGAGSSITITGGTVTATSEVGGAGIGGGNNSSTNTVSITGGFVVAQGGKTSGMYGAGAAIGSGGAYSKNPSPGTEATFTTDDTNAVVLTKPGTATTTTGTVYGSYTLAENVTLSETTTLTIPEGTSLTIASGTTLTNSGTIYQEGGSLQYGDSYGTLTGDGKLYYLLTVEGGTATATEGMATYNGKTYATQGTAVTLTLTAEDKVGLAFKEWTASPTSANVTFSKVDENDETNQNYQFTMPAQVLTVTAGYENAPTYTVTIPATVSIGDTATAAIEAESVNVAEGYNLNVKLTATSGTGNTFTLALNGHSDVTLDYAVTKTQTTVTLGTGEDATETTDTLNTTVNVNDTVLTIPGGTADSSGSSTLTFAMTSGQLKKYSGSYTGTVTFTVSVDEASDDSNNPGDDIGENP